MKINDVRDLSNTSTSTEPLQSRRTEARQEETVAPEAQAISEEVSISSASIEISKAAEMMEKESPERAEKIRSLQKAVQEGTYEVDPSKIAEKMLRDILSE